MQAHDLRWLEASPSGVRTPTPRPTPMLATGRRLLLALRYPVWPVLVLVLLLMGVLFQFQRVVAEGVVQGELRRSAAAAHADVLWRCRLISQLDERRLCLSQMAAH